MRTLFYLSESQLERIKPFFPRSHGAPRVDDRRVVSGIIYVIKHGLQWKDAPDEYGPHKTLYNRFIRWSRFCVFNKIFTELANKTSFDGSLMIDSTHLKAHRTAASLLKKGIPSRLIGRTKGGLNSKLHAVCDGHGRPVLLLLTEGQVSDYKGAAILQHLLPDNSIFLADGGYDASWLRESLKAKGITVCIPPRKTRNEELPFDKTLYKGRHLIENTFSKLKDWRRIATRYDRCAHTFFSAICLAVTVLFYLN
ncbi:IS5 family transposase [Mailhella massiliensis]|uniref:IS5 family transposase n=1 Tax=Mailhella massiliensis TaxID=1903261 RepID=UPI001184870B|nr:IS5 family transposase [Mailhella massiliensis]